MHNMRLLYAANVIYIINARPYVNMYNGINYADASVTIHKAITKLSVWQVISPAW